MDALTFIVAMTDALAWPLCAGIVLILFRKLIIDASRRLKTFKYGEAELAFDEAFVDAQEVASEVGVTIAGRAGSFPPAILQLAASSPTAAVIEGWQSIEKELKRLSDRAGVTFVTPARAIERLKEQGHLANGLAEICRYMIRVRNTVVHSDGDSPTEAQAIEFLMLSKSVSERISQEAI